MRYHSVFLRPLAGDSITMADILTDELKTYIQNTPGFIKGYVMLSLDNSQVQMLTFWDSFEYINNSTDTLIRALGRVKHLHDDEEPAETTGTLMGFASDE